MKPPRLAVSPEIAQAWREAVRASVDPEYRARLEADRVSAEWKTKRPPAAPQESLEDLPLFGGARQGGFGFEEKNPSPDDLRPCAGCGAPADGAECLACDSIPDDERVPDTDEAE